MKTCREWLNEKEINDFYNIELNQIEERLLISDASKKGNIDLYEIKPLFEAVIEPEKIKIRTNNITKLNEEFKKYNIVFNYSPNEVKAHYDKQKDEIVIFFMKTTEFNVIEALIGHEMVHREQHKKAGENYFEQSKKYRDELNSLANKINDIDMTNPNEVKTLSALHKKYKEMLDVFLFLTPYESMAYAYQFVKEFYYLTPMGIIKQMEKEGIKLTNKTKKYIAMYWLIKDKII